MPVQLYVVDNSMVLFSMVAYGFTSALCEIISNPDGAREPCIVEVASSCISASTRRQIYFNAVDGCDLIRNQMMDEPRIKLGTALFALCLAP